jgi:8-oxo-dGTP pyrophosphatase MutT (NUDIX family)
MDNELTQEQVAVTVIYCEQSILLVYNPRWGAFTLPMTKLRRWQYGPSTGPARVEYWDDAAMRNVGECLGIVSTEKPKLLMDIHDLRQSDWDAQPKHYLLQVFGFPVQGQSVAPGMACQWLPAKAIGDAQCRPISPTARDLVHRLEAEASLRGTSFPPPHPPGAPRRSVAGLALFQREDQGRKQWLSRWNDRWNRYFFVGGHKEKTETFRDCVVREVGEELGLSEHDDFEASADPRDAPDLKGFEEWSVAAWQQTHYEIELYDCELKEDARRLVAKDAANRWLSEAEIKAERSADGKLVSHTMRLIAGLAKLF